LRSPEKVRLLTETGVWTTETASKLTHKTVRDCRP
jgi:hypothetical protein